MKAVILCAGSGERMKPLTNILPKPLIKIENKPILLYIIRALPKEIEEIILVIKEEQRVLFENFLNENKIEKKISIVNQDKEKRGTYFALMAAKEFLIQEDKFLVLNGDDIFLKEDLENLISSNAPAYGISYKKLSDERYRTCDLDQEEGRITSFRKPNENEMDQEIPCFSGAVTLNKDFFTYEPAFIDGEAGIPHTLFSANVSVSHIILKEWYQINTLEDLKYAQKHLR